MNDRAEISRYIKHLFIICIEILDRSGEIRAK